MVLYNSLQVEFGFFYYNPLYDSKTGLDGKKKVSVRMISKTHP